MIMHPFLDHDVAIDFCNLHLHLRDMFIVIAWNYLSLLLIFIWTQLKILRDHFRWRVWNIVRIASHRVQLKNLKRDRLSHICINFVSTIRALATF